MPAIEENWQPVADTLGFRDVEHMLKDLYLAMNFSIHDIAKVVGYSSFAVRKRLVMLGVPLRSRGGPNHAGHRKLVGVKNEELMKPPREVAERFGVHLSTVFAEKRLRKAKKEATSEILSDSAGVLAEEVGSTK